MYLKSPPPIAVFVLNVSLQQPCQIWIKFDHLWGAPAASGSVLCPCDKVPESSNCDRIDLDSHIRMYLTTHSPMVFTSFLLFFVDVTLFFSSFLLVLSGTLPKKTKHQQHVSRVPCLKTLGSAQHLALRTQMTRKIRNIWNLRSKPHQI